MSREKIGPVEHLTFLLTGPGQFLADLFLPSTFALDNEARTDVTVTLGIAFWIIAYVTIRLSWHVVSRGRIASALDHVDTALREVLSNHAGTFRRTLLLASMVTWWRGWTWREVWSVVWRAQVVHLVVYAGVPLLWEAARWTFIVITFPLWVIGPGGGFTPTDGTLDHLRRPACWTFVAACSGPRSHVVNNPTGHASECRATPCPPSRGLFDERGGWVAKTLWATLTLTWVIVWRRQRAAAER